MGWPHWKVVGLCCALLCRADAVASSTSSTTPKRVLSTGPAHLALNFTNSTTTSTTTTTVLIAVLHGGECLLNDCLSQVSCPPGMYPIKCELYAIDHPGDSGDGAYVDHNRVCIARNGWEGSKTRAQVTCTPRETISIMSGNSSFFEDNGTVWATCPAGKPLSCNCETYWRAWSYCGDVSSFDPSGKYCTREVREGAPHRRRHTDLGMGVRVWAICPGRYEEPPEEGGNGWIVLLILLLILLFFGVPIAAVAYYAHRQYDFFGKQIQQAQRAAARAGLSEVLPMAQVVTRYWQHQSQSEANVIGREAIDGDEEMAVRTPSRVPQKRTRARRNLRANAHPDDEDEEEVRLMGPVLAGDLEQPQAAQAADDPRLASASSSGLRAAVDAMSQAMPPRSVLRSALTRYQLRHEP